MKGKYSILEAFVVGMATMAVIMTIMLIALAGGINPKQDYDFEYNNPNAQKAETQLTADYAKLKNKPYITIEQMNDFADKCVRFDTHLGPFKWPCKMYGRQIKSVANHAILVVNSKNGHEFYWYNGELSEIGEQTPNNTNHNWMQKHVDQKDLIGYDSTMTEMRG